MYLLTVGSIGQVIYLVTDIQFKNSIDRSTCNKNIRFVFCTRLYWSESLVGQKLVINGSILNKLTLQMTRNLCDGLTQSVITAFFIRGHTLVSSGLSRHNTPISPFGTWCLVIVFLFESIDK